MRANSSVMNVIPRPCLNVIRDRIVYRLLGLMTRILTLWARRANTSHPPAFLLLIYRAASIKTLMSQTNDLSAPVTQNFWTGFGLSRANGRCLLMAVLISCASFTICLAQNSNSDRAAEWKSFAIPTSEFNRIVDEENGVVMRVPVNWKKEEVIKKQGQESSYRFIGPY